MNRRILRILALLLGLLLLLPGCNQEEQPDVIPDSGAWKDIPQLNFGTLEYEKLSKLPWDSGRADGTSNYRIAETAKGYYFLVGTILYYADKGELQTWVPVCGKPNCNHYAARIYCDAYIIGNSFLFHNGRIVFSAILSEYRHLYPGGANGMALCSKAMDGTDMRLEYVIEEGLIQNGGGFSNYLSPEHWIYNVSQLQKDGTSVVKVFRRTEEKLEVLLEETQEEFEQGTIPVNIGGDRVFHNALLGDWDTVQRVEDGKLVTVDLGGYRETACYLYGDILRVFRPNDGYYDVNLTTGEEVFVCKAQLENSVVSMPLPNCIIETTLWSEDHPKEQHHKLVFFDGQQWHDLALPEELQLPVEESYLNMCSVGSDSIIISVQQHVIEEEVHYRDYMMFKISIEEDPAIEYLTTIKQRRPKNPTTTP